MVFVGGPPGAGKTVLSEQIAFHQAAQGQHTLLLTTLSEPHDKQIRHAEGFAWFEAARLGREIQFLSLYQVLQDGGTREALETIVQTVREQQAQLLVLDAFRGMREMVGDELNLRRFIFDLGGQLGILGVTVTSLPGALEAVAALLAEAVAADRVHSPSPRPGRGRPGGSRPSKAPSTNPHAMGGRDRLLIAGGGPVVETFITGTPSSTARAGDDPGEPRSLARDLGVRSALCVPLQVGDTRRGVLLATSTMPNVFSERDLRFLLAAAQWVGTVAHRAELVERATASAIETARAATTQDLVTTLADDLRRRTEPLARHVELARARAGQVGLPRDVGTTQEIRRRVRDLRRLVDDLLDVVRLEQGLFELRLEPVDLAELAREAAAPFRSTTQDVRVRAPAGVPVQVDSARLRQALEHMLAEVARRLPDGTPLVVEVLPGERRDGPWGGMVIVSGDPDALLDSSEQLEALAEPCVSSSSGVLLRLASRIAAAHGGG